MQRRTLVRAATLAAFRETLVAAAQRGDPLAARRRAIIVPTRASAELLRQSIEADLLRRGRRSLVLPHLITRDEWLQRLLSSLPHGKQWLSRMEREILLDRAARGTLARRRGLDPAPFELRPGLVSAMLDFYDELRRRRRDVRRFARTVFDELRVERGTDRGSEGLITQTRFLGLTFLAYERAVTACGGRDEHGLRRELIAMQPALAIRDVIVAVADPPSDPQGLWPADFDLLGRLHGIDSIEVVVTDELHDAGFRERLEQELPGIEEGPRDRAGARQHSAVLMRPAAGDDDTRCFVSRDREEELKSVARIIVGRAGAHDGTLREPAAIVFHRPLPYLYLAQQMLADAGLPYQAFDALPLAGEPYAALLDLALTAARTGGSRDAMIALLRSRLLRIRVDGVDVALEDAAALNHVLLDRRAAGDASTFAAEVEAWRPDRMQAVRLDQARRAARAAGQLHRELRAFVEGGAASEQVRAVAAFLRRYERLPGETDSWSDRHLRARGAVLGALDALQRAFRTHDDGRRHPETLTAMVHQLLESQTFAPRRGGSGVHLVDAVAARFGEFADVHLVGLVDTDWSDHTRRSLFYTSSLLRALSWPQQSDRRRAQHAAFQDLLRLAAERTWLHAFQLEGDTIVALSPLLESTRALPTQPHEIADDPVVLVDEIVEAGAVPAGLDPDRTAWLALRHSRGGLDGPRYRGSIGPQAPRAYRVSQVDSYVDCPFKYFAASVLGLPDDRGETSGLTPLERGTMLHALFERFYRDWDAAGLGAITAGTLPDALTRFRRLASEMLAPLPAPDRVLEQARWLGSIVSRGLAERVFDIEVEEGMPVRRRLLEFDVSGAFDFPTGRRIEIRGTADRVDLLANGSIRVIDYKLGRMPDLDRSVQAAVYAHCVRHLLQEAGQPAPPVHSARYLAFGDPWHVDGPIRRGREPAPSAVDALAGAFAAAVAGIESGRFPAQPLRPAECQWCAQAGVCRKEYLVEDDQDGSAEPV